MKGRDVHRFGVIVWSIVAVILFGVGVLSIVFARLPIPVGLFLIAGGVLDMFIAGRYALKAKHNE
jgi:uncharacterized membrane protein (UPF0136 family)